MNKPTKPSVNLPSSFGGTKTNFDSTKIANGYEANVKDILGGANLNYLLDTAGQRQTYYDAICDFINAIPIGKTIVTNSSNQLVYENYSTVAKTGSYNDLTNKPTNLANQDLSNLTSTGNSKLVPSQSGNANKFLITNGTSTSWKSLNVIDGEWQNATSSNINLTSVTAVGTYDIDLSSILPSDANDYECLCRYNFERRDNSSEDTGIKILSSDGAKTWVWEHVEGDPQLSTNYIRKSGQFIAIVGSSRKLKIEINTKPLNNNSIDLIMYRRCGKE